MEAMKQKQKPGTKTFLSNDIDIGYNSVKT